MAANRVANRMTNRLNNVIARCLGVFVCMLLAGCLGSPEGVTASIIFNSTAILGDGMKWRVSITPLSAV